MADQKKGALHSWRDTAKDIILAVLVLIVIAQSVLLWRSGTVAESSESVSENPTAAAVATEGPSAPSAIIHEREAQETTASTLDQSASKPSSDASASSTPTSEDMSASTESGDQGKMAVSVAGVFINPQQRRFVFVAFDAPVGPQVTQGEVIAAQTPPATLAPEISGNWEWLSPFLARFTSTKPFTPSVRYTVTIAPQSVLKDPAQFTGKSAFEIAFGDFQVEDVTFNQRVAEKGGAFVHILGRIDFNQTVGPQALMHHIAMYRDENGKQVSVPLSIITTYSSSQMEFETESVEKTSAGQTYTLVVSKGLRPREGDIELPQDVRESYTLKLDPFISIENVETQSNMGSGVIRFELSTPVLIEALKRHLSVTPDTLYSLTISGTSVTMRGDFTPGAEYRVHVKKGLQAEDSAVLSQNFNATVRMPDLASTVDFASQGMFLSRSGYGNLGLTSVNTNAVDVRVDKVYLNNLFALFNFEGWQVFRDEYYDGQINRALGREVTRFKANVPYKQNTTVNSTLSLPDLAAKSGPGLYRVAATVPGQYQGAQRWVLLTDIGLAAKLGTDDVLVYAGSFADNAPIPHVEIRIVNEHNQVVAEGRTNTNGLFYKKGLAKAFDAAKPYMVWARKGHDTSFLLFDQFGIDTAGLDVGGKTLSPEGYSAFVYGERNIYRPGERVEGMILVRDAQLATPPTMPLVLRLNDPRGNRIDETTVRLERQGAAGFRFEMPDYAQTGRYAMDVIVANTVIGEYRFQVEDFVPDRISVDITSKIVAAAPGKPLQYDVFSKYLFGAPASGMSVDTTVGLIPSDFKPKGFDDYTFGDPDRRFEAKEISKQDGRLNEAGEASFSVDIPENLSPPAGLTAVVVARVRERGGRGVSAVRHIPVHAYAAYPGLRADNEGAADPGKPFHFSYVLITPEGEPATTGALTARLIKDRWQTVLRRNDDGVFAYETVRDSRIIDSKTIKAPAGQGAFRFVPPDFGSYRVTLADPASGASASLSFYAGGSGYAPWAVKNPSRLELVTDKKDYAVGDSARIQVRAPFAGTLLLTLENDHVVDAGVFTVTGNTADITLNLPKACAPNCYVTGLLTRTGDSFGPGEVSRAFGATSVGVGRKAGQIDLAVNAPASMRPENPLAIEVTATPGALVTIAAVDEGILQLISQKTPDPFESFYAKRALAVNSFDIFSLLLPDIPSVDGLAPAGGGGFLDKLKQMVRTNALQGEAPVAFWSGPLFADATGIVRTTFTIPRFQGALRIMAVASDGERFGSTDNTVLVKSPLVLMPTFPRFLAMGDIADVPITVRNDTDADGEFLVQLAAKGPVHLTQSEMRISIPHGKEKTVFFKVQADQAEGQADFTVTANGNDEMAKYTAGFPVRSAYPLVTLVDEGVLNESQKTIPAADPANMVPATLRRSIRVGGSPIVRFSDKLQDLLLYPYGCLEQTVSRAFPLLYIADLAATLNPGSFDKGNVPAFVQDGITRVLSMQLSSGLFAMWPGSSYVDTFSSVYAADFLVQADRAGYGVSRYNLDKAIQALQNTVHDESLTKRSIKTVVYGLYVLALAGRADFGVMDHLFEKSAATMSEADRALLAAAYAAVGNKQAMSRLLKMTSPLHKEGAPAASGYEERDAFSSALRNQALRINALLSADPSFPALPNLVQKLSQALANKKLTSTQENAFALLALGRYAEMERKQGSSSGTVYVGDTELGRFTSKQAYSAEGVTGEGPVRIVLEKTVKQGSVFYNVVSRFVPTAQSYTPKANGLSVMRSIMHRNGTPVEPGEAMPQGGLLIVKTSVSPGDDPIDNVVVQTLLPAGLEVENPRLATSEQQVSFAKEALFKAQYTDIRNDQFLFFINLNEKGWVHQYSLLRAVTPGKFAFPPVMAQAMYDPQRQAYGDVSTLDVTMTP
ncbi:alpha-2-macroglobulin family protein [Desulfovibrio inopinatus]|uniref:alpha-2-macroglobulin family protein n=1 Tax=Desulfovibrio inopinatus TaxID=102109 RepID=UPI000402066C|nr:MG2 domain-containing protein [Desulfovibrio inopinatus]